MNRFSSRRQRLDNSFLAQRLKGAKAYDRIAGYFCGSILETAGEALESVQGPIRVVCNSGLQRQDVATARAAAAALRQEWCGSQPEALVDKGGEPAKARLARLHQFLASGKMQVKVLPDRHFGLIHGKAGVITLPDGAKTAFLGSVNESKSAWTLNYELLWEDPSLDAVQWVEEEFNALWTHHAAVPLAGFIIEDIARLSRRVIVPGVKEWTGGTLAPGQAPPPASVFVEAPVYRKQAGLWEHQKFFVKLAFDAHLNNPGGARFVLADQVGLGKTVQLAMAAELMALSGDKPVLVLAPKSLLWQWQDELLELLDMPSAVWTGKNWVDENEVEYPAVGPDGIKKCPRRVGIVPNSRATFGCADAELLKYLEETKDPTTGEPHLKPIAVELLGERGEDAIKLPLYLREAYALAEEFCQALGARMKGSGFLKTLLLRRVGSSIAAGRATAEKMLGCWQDIAAVSATTEGDEDEQEGADAASMSRTLTPDERTLLERFVKALEASQERDPKYAVALDCLKAKGWLDRGCIVFSQYYDSVHWLAEQLVHDLPGERIAIYAGSGRSGIWEAGQFQPVPREDIKQQVRRAQLRLVLGTDAASEGLNLQRLATLINLDLPWNATRLEQRKGRIQRTGQLSDTVWVYNMRYLDSVEDRVHQLLSNRLQDIYTLFGQVPDVLEDVWIDVALGEVERARQVVAAVPKRHPFDIKYQRIEKIDWETCEHVLSATAKRSALTKGWSG